MKYVFPVSMIAIGSFLEVYYYSFRFSSDGIPLWLAVIIGVALTLLLALAVYMRRNRWMWPVIILVSAYSIFATSAGQAFSLGEVLRDESATEVRSEYTLDEIQDLESQISRVDDEIDRITSEIAETTTSLEDRGLWRSTLAAAEDRQDELRERRDMLASRLSDLRSSAQQHTDVETRSRNIYRFYGDMLGWSTDWLQFGLQTVLSTFIAAMAPVGIITLPRRKRKQTRRQRTESKNNDMRDEVASWVHRNWIGIRSGKSPVILGVESYSTFVENHGEVFNRQRYNSLVRRALNAGVIESGGKIMVPDENTAVELMMSVDK